MIDTGYKLTHNTWLEGVRIILVEIASLLFAIVTIPWRLLHGRKP